MSALNLTEDVRKYATKLAISKEEVLLKGMAKKSKEFLEAGAEAYAKA